MKKGRIVYLDMIRVLSCMLVVLMHSPCPGSGAPGYIVVPIYFITAAGLCLFFMVSGALLLPVKMDTFTFLKKRIGKILVPLLFWTLFYLGVSLAFLEKTWNEVWHNILSIPFTRQGHGILWFLYVLIGMYLLSPVISPMLQKASKNEVQFYLLIWGITLCYPLLAPFVVLTTDTYGILYYFSGFLGYFVLGHYLHTYKPQISKLGVVVLMIIPIIVFVVFNAAGIIEKFDELFWYEGLMVAMLCVAFFCGAKMVIGKFQKIFEGQVLIMLSNCTFGVYLIHIFIMRRILWKVDLIIHGIGGIGQIVLTWWCTLILSFVLTWAISYLPYSEYIIGFTSRKKK